MGIKLQSSSGGSVEIAAPVTASNYVLTAPAANGTILNDASSLAAAMLTGNVDVARLVSAFSGSNVSLASSGYQKLPSGLIIQWGQVSASGNAGSQTSTSITFPISFPVGLARVLTSIGNAYPTTYLNASAEGVVASGFILVTSSGQSYSGYTFRWFAIGY